MIKIDKKTSMLPDRLLWIAVISLFIGGMTANYYFAEQPNAYRIIGWLILIPCLFGLTLLTEKGKQLQEFAMLARTELRKVVWPTKQETSQTTIIVFVMVIAVGILLWGIDAFFLWAVGKITIFI